MSPDDVQWGAPARAHLLVVVLCHVGELDFLVGTDLSPGYGDPGRTNGFSRLFSLFELGCD